MSLPTPSPYSLQGMSEKIHFQRFIRQHPLQLGDLPTQYQLAGSRIGRVYFFESIAPVVKQSSRYPKLSRKPEYVVAGLHSLESLASKFITVSLPFLSLHFAAPFSQSVHHKLSHSSGSLQSANRNPRSEPLPETKLCITVSVEPIFCRLTDPSTPGFSAGADFSFSISFFAAVTYLPSALSAVCS